MIAEKVAQFIAAKTSYVLGTDIWLHNLPSHISEGIAVKFIRDFETHDKIKLTRIAIFPLYISWAKQKEVVDAVKAVFLQNYGKLQADWATSGEVETHFFGKDDKDRFVSSITINIKGE